MISGYVKTLPADRLVYELTANRIIARIDINKTTNLNSSDNLVLNDLLSLYGM